jgi:hypothetical protein
VSVIPNAAASCRLLFMRGNRLTVTRARRFYFIITNLRRIAKARADPAPTRWGAMCVCVQARRFQLRVGASSAGRVARSASQALQTEMWSVCGIEERGTRGETRTASNSPVPILLVRPYFILIACASIQTTAGHDRASSHGWPAAQFPPPNPA